MEQDIRWLQRYDSYCKACKRVLLVTESERKPYELTELEMETENMQIKIFIILSFI